MKLYVELSEKEKNYFLKKGLNKGVVVQEGALTVELLEKTYKDFCNAEGNESYCIVDGKKYCTDMGYALEGMQMLIDVVKRRTK